MKDKTLKILLGIIAVNLTFQTVKDVGLFPTAYAQNDVQQVEICGYSSRDNESTRFTNERLESFNCAEVSFGELEIND